MVIKTADFKHVGREVLELRFHFGAKYRVYCATKQDTLLPLLTGGDKSSQRKDIETAQRLLDEARKELDTPVIENHGIPANWACLALGLRA